MSSPPSQGAWIEMHNQQTCHTCLPESPPSQGAWIEIIKEGVEISLLESPPSQGAWIEMSGIQPAMRRRHVAPLAGGVD